MCCMILVPIGWIDSTNKVTTHFELSAKGRPPTQITYIREILPDGTLKLVQIRKKKSGDQTYESVEGRFFAKDGSCSKATAIAKSGKGVAALAVTFPEGRAVVTLEMTTMSKKSRTEYLVPKGLSTKTPSRYWFINTQPKVGAKSKFAEFAISTLSWIVCIDEYKGQVTFRHEGKEVRAHKVVGRDHVSLFDKARHSVQSRIQRWLHSETEVILVQEGTSERAADVTNQKVKNWEPCCGRYG